mgnify:CR=1 FL=1
MIEKSSNNNATSKDEELVFQCDIYKVWKMFLWPPQDQCDHTILYDALERGKLWPIQPKEFDESPLIVIIGQSKGPWGILLTNPTLES